MKKHKVDLCVLDSLALNHSWERVQARKQMEEPVFLPVLLIISHADVQLLTQHLWQTIDELISKPIEKLELQAPIEMLLRSRRLSFRLQTALEQERLFESFYRASNIASIPGTGLGLAIVKQMVEQYGGTVSVTSQLGVGSCLTVQLSVDIDQAA